MGVKVLSDVTTNEISKSIDLKGITTKIMIIDYINNKPRKIKIADTSTAKDAIDLLAGQQVEDFLLLIREYTHLKEKGEI